MSTLLLILISAAVFTGIVLSLVIVILIAKSRLVPKGNVRLTINNSDEYEVPLGGSLLSTLSDKDIYIPSACGGGGTCAQCKIQIEQGGGSILPTETSMLTRTEIHQGYRLACQVRVKDSMELIVPHEILDVKKIECTVKSNRNVATFIKELVLELPPGEPFDFKAGGYIQIVVPPHTVQFNNFDIGENFRSDWEQAGLFRYSSTVHETITRAYSMANYSGEKGVIILNVRIALPPRDNPKAPPGQMTSYIFNLKPGDTISLTGPFGDFYARDTENEMVFIGGGAGMAPMRSHIFDQLKRIGTDRKISFWYGARSLKEAFYTDDFKSLEKEHPGFSFTLALSEARPEDNWNGPSGFIHTVVLENYLKTHPEPEDCEYYLCGPPLMIDAVLKMLDSLGVEPENILFDDFGA